MEAKGKCKKCDGSGVITIDLHIGMNREYRRKMKNDSQRFKNIPCPDCHPVDGGK
jgi:DnaJ-class molecular chaperone